MTASAVSKLSATFSHPVQRLSILHRRAQQASADRTHLPGSPPDFLDDAGGRDLQGSPSPHTLLPETHVGRSHAAAPTQLALVNQPIASPIPPMLWPAVLCAVHAQRVHSPLFTPSEPYAHRGGRVFPNPVTIASELEASFSPRSNALSRVPGKIRAERARGHASARKGRARTYVATAALIRSVPRLDPP
ncbi:hypothetical protein VTO73DRAFT_6049 [Trametes versicolor]